MDAEMDAIRVKEDIVSLHSRQEGGAFDSGIDTMIGKLDRILQRILRTKNPPRKVGIAGCARGC
jgi:hypothetical protein